MRTIPLCIVTTMVAACGATEPPSYRDLELATGGIEIPAGVEGIYCWYFEVNEPAGSAIVGFVADSGAGVHHLALFADGGPGPMPAPGPCEGFRPGWEMMYTAGWSTEPLVLPDGVGLPVGTQRFVLQGHFANVSEAAIATRMAVTLRIADDQLTIPAALFIIGTDNISIPPAARDHVVSARCDAPVDVSLAYAFPHLHALGHHVRLTAEIAASTSVLVESDWSLATQRYLSIASDESIGGTRLRLDCHYDNPGADPVVYGLAAQNEMCQMALIAYPLERSVNCFD